MYEGKKKGRTLRYLCQESRVHLELQLDNQKIQECTVDLLQASLLLYLAEEIIITSPQIQVQNLSIRAGINVGRVHSILQPLIPSLLIQEGSPVNYSFRTAQVKD